MHSARKGAYSCRFHYATAARLVMAAALMRLPTVPIQFGGATENPPNTFMRDTIGYGKLAQAFVLGARYDLGPARWLNAMGTAGR